MFFFVLKKLFTLLKWSRVYHDTFPLIAEGVMEGGNWSLRVFGRPLMSVCRLIGRSVSHNFLKGWEVTLSFSYRSTCLTLLNRSLYKYAEARIFHIEFINFLWLKVMLPPWGAFRNCLKSRYFTTSGRGIGYSFQLAITAPLYSIIGYCIATAQSC